MTPNFGALGRLTRNLGTVERLAQNLGTVERLAQNLGTVERLAQNLGAAERLALNFGAAERLAQNLGTVERLAQNLGAAERLAQNFGAADRLAQNFGAAERAGGVLDKVGELADWPNEDDFGIFQPADDAQVVPGAAFRSQAEPSGPPTAAPPLKVPPFVDPIRCLRWLLTREQREIADLVRRDTLEDAEQMQAAGHRKNFIYFAILWNGVLEVVPLLLGRLKRAVPFKWIGWIEENKTIE